MQKIKIVMLLIGLLLFSSEIYAENNVTISKVDENNTLNDAFNDDDELDFSVVDEKNAALAANKAAHAANKAA